MSTAIPPEKFTTQRILGRKPRLEDAQAMFDCYASDPLATLYLSFPPYQEASPIRLWIEAVLEQWENNPGINYLLFLREQPHKLIGACSFRLDSFKADVGYVFGQAYWNYGYATEVLKHWISWGLAQENIYREGAICDVDNTASARVMQKAGMQCEGRLLRYAVHPNTGPTPRDVFSYSKVK